MHRIVGKAIGEVVIGSRSDDPDERIRGRNIVVPVIKDASFEKGLWFQRIKPPIRIVLGYTLSVGDSLRIFRPEPGI
ncbi:hypothetical protein [Paenibacillus ginsengarvi]|uniref:hypothetical protein n=1 Tax=Paenibacillus ginsengarvi TaxID=400777 RepID=UPI00187661EA|nr:hypothetical protein [Paenibacillus ginsengarvi]